MRVDEDYQMTKAIGHYQCRPLIDRIEQLERKLSIAQNTLESLNYPENPDILIVESALELLENER